MSKKPNNTGPFVRIMSPGCNLKSFPFPEDEEVELIDA